MIIVLVGVLAKIVAFIEEAVLAAYLGMTSQSDAYYMVWSVHAVVYPMMSIGIWNVFLPLYKSHIAKEEKETAYALTNKSLSFFTLTSCIVVILLIVFAPIVVSVVAPGFRGSTRDLCIRLVRISAPMYVLIIASAVYAAVLRCHDRFLGSQIREVASHVPTILAAFFFYRRYGMEAMAVALVVAGLLRLLIELPFVNWDYRYKPDLDFRSEEFRLMLKRLPSALVSAGVAQLNALIDKAMASLLPEGTVSCLNYGNKLMNVFSGLLSSAIAAATYPQMIELITLDKKDELGKLVVKIINTFSILMFPVTLACILFRTELVSAVFERGAFDAKSTTLTARVFALYCLGLFFIASNTVISNIFYGHGDTRTAMRISIANLIINIILNLVLVRLWGVNGLALATSLSAIITFFVRLSFAEKYVKLDNKKMISTAVRVLIAATIACMFPRKLFCVYPLNKEMTLLFSAIIGCATYLLLIRLLKVPEVNDLVNLLKRKTIK